MKFLIWLLIGRFTLQMFLSLSPIDQAGLLEATIKRYCEDTDCYKAEIIIEQTDEHIKVYANCKEVVL